MLDNVRLDFSGDKQLLDLVLALISIGDTMDRWLPSPGEAITAHIDAPADTPADPLIDAVLGLVAVRETLRRGLSGAGISPQPPSQAPSPVVEMTPTAARDSSTFLR